jgi:hypothetical protein
VWKRETAVSDQFESWDNVIEEAEKDTFVGREHKLIFYSAKRMGDHTAR